MGNEVNGVPDGEANRATSGEAINIILIDDDVVDVMNVQRAFAKGNILNPIFVAHDGIEGLALLRGDACPKERRLVLLDLNMPRMNGIEMLRELRLDPSLKALPVVILTTSNEDRDRTDAYGFNVAGFLLKPVTFINFVELMSAMNRFWRLVEFP